MAADRNYLYVNEVLNGDILRYTLPLRSNSIPDVRLRHLRRVHRGLRAGGTGRRILRAQRQRHRTRRPALHDGQRRRTKLRLLRGLSQRPAVRSRPGHRGSVGVVQSRHPRRARRGHRRESRNSASTASPSRTTAPRVFMANMSMDVIYRMPVNGCRTGCQPTSLREFARGQGLNGPDNIDFDENGILWVASGQNDRVVGINRDRAGDCHDRGLRRLLARRRARRAPATVRHRSLWRPHLRRQRVEPRPAPDAGSDSGKRMGAAAALHGFSCVSLDLRARPVRTAVSE